MARVDADWVGQQLENGRYHVTAVLGAGGMGTVYRARDTKLEADVVVKVPHPNLLAHPRAAARFRREIRALAQLAHPHIVRIHDVGEHDGLPYLVMQFLPGGSLLERIEPADGGPANRLPLPALRQWLPDVADALDYLHGEGLVHRDVKPHNILFDAAGRAYLADFGLIGCLDPSQSVPDVPAATLGHLVQTAPVTRLGQVLGTPHYLAPEIGTEKADGRADQYALAVTVYYGLCGRPPFEGPPHIVLGLHQAVPAPAARTLVPDLPEATSAALDRGLAKDPAQRFPSCKEFAEAVLSGLTVSQPAPAAVPVAEPAGQTPRQSPMSPTRVTQVPITPVATPVTPTAVTPAPRTPVAPPVRLPEPSETESVGRRSLTLPRAPWAWALLALGLLMSFGCVGVVGVGLWKMTMLANLRPRPAGSEGDAPAPAIPEPGPTSGEPGLPPTIPEPKPARPDPQPRPIGPVPPKDGYVNSLGMGFAWVPPGKFWMGGGGGKAGDQEVEIGQGFYLGIHEVTQEEWRQVMVGQPNASPSAFSRAGASKERVQDIADDDLRQFPVENVSWDEVQEFLKQLNAREHAEGWVYRLPRETEWEYACRGAPTTKEACTDDFYLARPSKDLSSQEANFHGGQPGGRAARGPNLRRSAQIGSYPPNPLGLYDLHGNVWEWCDDLHGSGPGRVVRGGSWYDGGSSCQAAYRISHAPSVRSNDLGFRLARVPSGAVAAVPKPPTPVAPKPEPKPEPLAKDFTNSIGMKLVLIPAGTFTMGSPKTETDRQDDEEQHVVEITQPFYLGVYEVTQEEYAKVRGVNPSWSSAGGSGRTAVQGVDTRRFPVDSVSWEDAMEFCHRLTEHSEERQAGRVYRLPTEAEWEYACREGALDYYTFHFGNDLSSNLANFHGKYPFGNAPEGPYLRRPTPVGLYKPNAFGLYDMHGNVWEWCADYYDKDYYRNSPRRDPRNDTKGSGSLRVLRGGSWFVGGHHSRAANRSGVAPGLRYVVVGFRVAVAAGPRTP